MPDKSEPPKYPLLEEILAIKGLRLQGTYRNADVARIFDVSVRTIQEWTSSGKLIARDLPGKGKFLSVDLEDFLRNSQQKQFAGQPNSSAKASMSRGTTH